MATGQTMLSIPATAAERPSTGFATAITRNNRRVARFSATEDQKAYFSFVLPRSYSGNGLDVYLHWASDATSGNVYWRGKVERVSDGALDIDTDGLDTAINATAAVNASARVAKTTLLGFGDPGDIDDAVAGDLIRLEISRMAGSEPTDTAASAADLLFIEVKET